MNLKWGKVFGVFLGVFFCSPAFAGEGNDSNSTTRLTKALSRQLPELVKTIENTIRPIGSIPASPSNGQLHAPTGRAFPFYEQHWVRDAYGTLDAFHRGLGRLKQPAPAVFPEIFKFYRLLQGTPNFCGEAFSSGLGEPLFHLDGQLFKKPWGRAQTDGAATFSLFALQWLGGQNVSVNEMSEEMISIIAHGNPARWQPTRERENRLKNFYGGSAVPDALLGLATSLSYSLHLFPEGAAAPITGFDLWEEQVGNHFYNDALNAASLFAAADYFSQTVSGVAGNHLRLMLRHAGQRYLEWMKKNYFHFGARPTVDSFVNEPGPSPRTTRLDAAVLMGFINTIHVKEMAEFFSEPSILSAIENHREDLEKSFVDEYPINRSRKTLEAYGLLKFEEQFGPAGPPYGRYPGDSYDGWAHDEKYPRAQAHGNPWFWTTHNAATTIYKIAELRLKKGDPGSLAGAQAALAKGDAIVVRSLFHATRRYDTAEGETKSDPNFSSPFVKDFVLTMQEQFNRVTGMEQGAASLNMSYATLIQLILAREQLMNAISKL